MPLVERINLVDNSVISAIDRLNVKDGDTLVFYIKMDENGDYLIPVDKCQKFYNFIQKFVNQNFNNVKLLMIPEEIRYDNGDG